MATTWIKAIHKSGSISAALDRSIDYIENPGKTNNSELIDSYECDQFTAQSEFLFSKKLYEQKTGRSQDNHDVIAYHIRMSFKSGEVTANQALEIGRELALKWTKGRHQFIVAAHTNTNNPHVHIIFNSVNLDCTGKYQDFKRSAIALRRVGDQICLEHGLSVIEKPGLSKGFNRMEYLGEKKPPKIREQLCEIIDSVLPGCKSFDEFLAALESVGVEIKRGKQLSFRLPGGKKFSRQDTLGDDYSVEAILERIVGKRIVTPKQKTAKPGTSKKFNLLIDIQSKIQQAYSSGFEHFAKIYNLKEAAKTLMFLQEHDLTDYTSLSEKTTAAIKHFNESSERIKVINTRLLEISSLQKHIGIYGRTLDVYRGYRESKWSKKYYAEHESNILLHKEAKKAFDDLGLEKLPTIKMLQTEYATLAAEKKKLYQGYHVLKDEMIALCMAKQNVESFLNITPQVEKPKEKSGMSL